MTPEEQVEEFMKGWRAGAALGEGYETRGAWSATMRRGFEAGRGASMVAERVERERAGLVERHHGCAEACEPIGEEPGAPDTPLPAETMRFLRSVDLDEDDGR